MFSVDIKTNGRLIASVYGRNLCQNLKKPTYWRYYWEYYIPEYPIQSGTLEHKREDGIEKLLIAILNKVKPNVARD